MSQWKIPSPHDVLFGLVVVATAVTGMRIFPDGSRLQTAAQLVMGIAGLIGIRVAAGYLPPHVKEVLAEHDEQVKTAMTAQAAAPSEPPRTA